MTALITRHRIAFCLTLFAAMMLAWKLAITWAVDNIGGWTAILAIVAFLLVAAAIDRRDNQRSSCG